MHLGTEEEEGEGEREGEGEGERESARACTWVLRRKRSRHVITSRFRV